MPRRSTPFVTRSYYHVLNRGVNRQDIFFDTQDYYHVEDIIRYYRFSGITTPFSYLDRLNNTFHKNYLETLEKEGTRRVEVVNHCLMPNHFHILVRQEEDQGISRFMSDFQNGFSRYINQKYGRIGPLFQGQFKAVPVESEEQLLQLIRYIFLNPYSAGLIDQISEIFTYPYSSLPQYLTHSTHWCETSLLKQFFTSKEQLKKFIGDYADHQRSLAHIKHLLLEES
ncbi:transposase, partial [Candidatus Berkelbacteria bacterium]|nr:transposase [Candidatus Berkelbacteria bacterium]